KDTFDVLLLLGGFSLKETLEKSWQEFRSLKKILMLASEGGHVELDNVKLSVEEIERIEGILKKYMDHTVKVIKGVQEEQNEGEEDEG
ncbi:MAG: hypothetical protein KKI06_08150, partial [Euryarchaeota archaeon]|nr:hypothetical protein [Euryarchaeota archaeon]